MSREHRERPDLRRSPGGDASPSTASSVGGDLVRRRAERAAQVPVIRPEAATAATPLARRSGASTPGYPVRMSPWNTALLSILPTLVVGGIFWFTIRAIIRADRTERKVYNRIEAEERARLGLPPVE
ncbi:hypothetical protein FJ658_09845 [Schumannella sp. 10F1B-5-1]|nr:hypothetical protein FJ658_09845 [Schumannella sp. 10F1B-5-1]